MKNTWLIIGVLIIPILIHPFTFMNQASPINRNHNAIQYIYTNKYIRDWSIKNDSINSSYKNIHSIIEPCQTRNSNHDNSRLGGTKNGPMDSPWPMLSHDIRHTGHSPYSTADNLGAEIWRIRGHESGEVWSSAVIDEDNIIYFATIGSDSALYAIYQNGSIKWRYQADGRIWCTPAIAEDGTLYFTTWGGYGYVHAVYPNGTRRWLYHNGYDSSSLSSPTIGNDGTIYFGSEEYKIYAVNPDGSEKWRYLTGYIIMSSPAIGNDDTIYIGSGDHYLYALYPNGTLRWRFPTGGEIKGSATIAPDGTIYVPSFDGYLYALNSNGTMKWRASSGGSIAAAGVALAEDGTIYVGTEQLRAFNPNGSPKWTTDVHGSIYGTVPAVSADGTIYVSAGGSLVAVNPDGIEKWRKSLSNEQIYSSPNIGDDGRVYIGSTYRDYGYLHAFGIGPLRAEAGGPYTGLASDTPVDFQGLVFGGTPSYSFYWDFGDGNTSIEQNPSHIYRNIGTYNALFTVTDSEGRMSNDNATIIISYGPPHVNFLKPQAAIYFANMRLCPFLYPLVFGRITVEVEASHPFLSIERVEFYKWDHLQMTDTMPPYTWTWSERIPLGGTHKIGITIKAYTAETTGFGFIEITKFF
jgi:outer membrane protein assembly factor BamB